jgi:hypothetical protein
MTRRSPLLVAALGLLASLAFTTPTQAEFIISVAGGYSVSNPTAANTIQTITINFTGLNGISDLVNTGTGIDVTGGTPPVVVVSPTFSATGPQSVELNYTSAPRSPST